MALTDPERAVLDAIRTARDLAPGDAPAVSAALHDAEQAVYALAGARDQGNVEQAEHLAEQVVLLTDAVTPARVRGATATAKQLVDGSLSIAVKVPPVPEDEPVPEAAPDGEASP